MVHKFITLYDIVLYYHHISLSLYIYIYMIIYTLIIITFAILYLQGVGGVRGVYDAVPNQALRVGAHAAPPNIILYYVILYHSILE